METKARNGRNLLNLTKNWQVKLYFSGSFFCTQVTQLILLDNNWDVFDRIGSL